MTSHVLRHPQAAALHRLAALLFVLGRATSAAAKRLDRWLEARRMTAGGRAELSAMSDRDLHDIGITRADVESVARGGSPLFRPD